MYKNNSINNKKSHLEILENTADIHIKQQDNSAKNTTEKQLASILVNFLKYGVLIANGIVLIGAILYLTKHGSEQAQYQIFHGTAVELRSPVSIVDKVLAGNSSGIIQFGILVLVSIPILRVIISFLTFLWRRDFIYVVITALVLASLGYGLIAKY